jgi:transcriptional regulator with XRE-family HTH domain
MAFPQSPLRAVRQRLGLSVHEVGAAAGCAGNMVSALERGDRLTGGAMFVRLARFYGLDVARLRREMARWTAEVKQATAKGQEKERTAAAG